MKKFISATVAVLLATLMCACTNRTMTVSGNMEKPLPWRIREQIEDTCGETITYNVTVYGLNKYVLTTSESRMIMEYHEESFDSVNVGVLETCLDIQYKSNSGNIDDDTLAVLNEDEGMHDIITTYAMFRLSDLTAIKSRRTATLQARGSRNDSYDITTDYMNGTIDATFANGDDKHVSFARGDYYDNEYVYYLMRAFKHYSLGTSFSYSIVSPYESVVNGKLTSFSMQAGVSSTEILLALPDSILSRIEDKELSVQDNTAKCYSVSAFINNVNKSGPPIDVAYLQGNVGNNINTATTKRLPVRIRAYSYDVANKLEYRRIECNIATYSVSGT